LALATLFFAGMAVVVLVQSLYLLAYIKKTRTSVADLVLAGRNTRNVPLPHGLAGRSQTTLILLQRVRGFKQTLGVFIVVAVASAVSSCFWCIWIAFQPSAQEMLGIFFGAGMLCVWTLWTWLFWVPIPKSLPTHKRRPAVFHSPKGHSVPCSPSYPRRLSTTNDSQKTPTRFRVDSTATTPSPLSHPHHSIPQSPLILNQVMEGISGIDEEELIDAQRPPSECSEVELQNARSSSLTASVDTTDFLV